MSSLRLQFRDMLRGFGATQVIAFAALCALVMSAAALFIVYTGAPAVGIDTQPAENVQEVPATGSEGFPVEVFCKDAATEVRERIRPDGVIYELMRVKADIPELVVWAPGPSNDNQGAILYRYDDQGVQVSEPAIVTEGARDCIREKAK